MPTYECALCGKKGTADRMRYSSHTGRRFCFDYTSCRARAEKNKRRRKKEAA